MTGVKTDTGKNLNKRWNVGAQHALYHKDGTWYQILERFPGALFDHNGYVLFNTKEQFKKCSYLNIRYENKCSQRHI